MNDADRLTNYDVYIVSKYGTMQKAEVLIEDLDSNVEPVLVWRTKPNRLSCKFSYVRYVNEPTVSPLNEECSRVAIQVNAYEIVFELATGDEAAFFVQHLQNMCKKAMRISNMEKALKFTKQLQLFASFTAEASMKEEQLTQMTVHLRHKEGWMLLERTLSKLKKKVQLRAFAHLVTQTKEANVARMNSDRHRWRLHAASNQEIDLQAWYHALFYQEVYRLRGKFFYKDAILPVYRQSYDLVDNALTPMEEAALAHVLCSPDTTYGDVAGQMFIVQSIMPAAQYELFQQLAAQGCTVVKHPRQGRPAKKLFRFSFVEGNIYLTWKGKFGNQGVGMSEVTEIVGGIQTDVLKWSAQSAKAGQYLSVLCADRSIDLYFESVVERNNWRDVLQALVLKEQGVLVPEIPGVEPAADSETRDFDWLVLYASIGKRDVPPPVLPPGLLAAMQQPRSV